MNPREVHDIRVSWTSDSLWGKENPEDYDHERLEKRHRDILIDMLMETYPNAWVHLVRDARQLTLVNGEVGTEEVHVIADIEAKAHQQWLDELGEED